MGAQKSCERTYGYWLPKFLSNKYVLGNSNGSELRVLFTGKNPGFSSVEVITDF